MLTDEECHAILRKVETVPLEGPDDYAGMRRQDYENVRAAYRAGMLAAAEVCDSHGNELDTAAREAYRIGDAAFELTLRERASSVRSAAAAIRAEAEK